MTGDYIDILLEEMKRWSMLGKAFALEIISSFSVSCVVELLLAQFGFKENLNSSSEFLEPVFYNYSF